jgi:small-conductance mechanosensitive channel
MKPTHAEAVKTPLQFINFIIQVVLLLFITFSVSAQTDTVFQEQNSGDKLLLQEFSRRLAEIEQKRLADSIRKSELEQQIISLKTTDNIQKEELQRQLSEINSREQQMAAERLARIDALRETVTGSPVTGPLKDTLFYVYSRIGSLTPNERADNISRKINILFKDDLLKTDSIRISHSENSHDIIYGDFIIMSISENDALWYNMEAPELADNFKKAIVESITEARKNRSFIRLLGRTGLVLLVLTVAWFLIRMIGKGYQLLLRNIIRNQSRWLKNLAYKDYTFLSAEQELRGIFLLLKAIRGFSYILLVYFTLPIIFSIFPFTRGWADDLFNLVWSPFKGVFIAVWNYIPNLFTILVIVVVMKYFIKFVRYIFSEIEAEKLKLSGFHSDWAIPTYSIVRFLLYAFMFVMIFPYLPGSDSDIFKGVSVFIGILFSLGSSSAIANMVAGLVITYMRPFKINDRIKIGETTGDVIEKTLLVTRLRTIKNEIITIPNSTILTGNTTNYSTYAGDLGLIVHTTVTIGYDVPWRDMHQALIDAALKTEMIQAEPKPFVLQTALEDFYVAYQINAYTKNPEKQALIYSCLHQNIQDICNERGIEILSPHYRAARDGNHSTIPSRYLPGDYLAPEFNIKLNREKKDTSNEEIVSQHDIIREY